MTQISLTEHDDDLTVVADPSPEAGRGRRLVTPLGGLIVATGVVMPLVYLLVHRGDQAGTDHTAGVWLALSEWARRGELIPPLQQGGFYNGTRYMPLPIEISSLLGGWIGSDVVAARLLSMAGAFLAAAAVYAAARVLGFSRMISALVGVALLTTPILIEQLRGIHSDALPAAALLFAIVLLLPLGEGADVGARRVVAAGALCGLAPLLKISEVWGLGALGLFLLIRTLRTRRAQPLAQFVAGAGVTLVLGSAWSLWATGGRILPNLSALLLSGEDSPTAAMYIVTRLVRYGAMDLGLLVALLALGVLDTLLVRRGADLLLVALLTVTALTYVLYADRGIEGNHLIDFLLVATACTLRAVRRWRGREAFRVGVTVLTGFALASAWLPQLTHLADRERSPFYTLPSSLTSAGPVLTEDVSVSLSSGQLPVVLDAFSFRRLALRDPALGRELEARIAAHEFPAVVLLSSKTYEEANWYDTKSLGTGVFAAVCSDYHSGGLVGAGRYEIFLPGSSPDGNAHTICKPDGRTPES